MLRPQGTFFFSPLLIPEPGLQATATEVSSCILSPAQILHLFPCITVEFLGAGTEVVDPKGNACVIRVGGGTFLEDGDYSTNPLSSLLDWHNAIRAMAESKGNFQHMVCCRVFVAICVNIVIVDGEAIACGFFVTGRD